MCLRLVLDNCEHVLGACQIVAFRLLQSCASVRILATSRQPLDIPGETAWRVPSLELPARRSANGVEEISDCDAMDLFGEARPCNPLHVYRGRSGPTSL
jgi:predicted ATPase